MKQLLNCHSSSIMHRVNWSPTETLVKVMQTSYFQN